MDCTAATSAAPESPDGGRTPRENWSALVTELMEQHDMTQPQIAAVCRCGQSTISDLARGATTDPRHSTGEALRELVATKRRESTERAVAASEPQGGAGTGSARPGRN